MTASQSVYQGRPTRINYLQVDELFYVGNYQRTLPVSLSRMMENAYDWEHLPFVHPSTFHDIDIIEAGNWGWRAEVGSAKSGGKKRSKLELLVDLDHHYWATTVVQGNGEGVEIHTQATAVSDQKIEIDVRFYLPSPVGWLRKRVSHLYLKGQYKNLYDEDERLMLGRQSAIDEKKHWRQQQGPDNDLIFVGNLAELDRSKVQLVESTIGRYCVFFYTGEWRAYSAVCPHQLGKLEHAVPQQNGQIICPWHGYAFDIITGENLDKRCAKLAVFAVVEQAGGLYLVHNDTA